MSLPIDLAAAALEQSRALAPAVARAHAARAWDLLTREMTGASALPLAPPGTGLGERLSQAVLTGPPSRIGQRLYFETRAFDMIALSDTAGPVSAGRAAALTAALASALTDDDGDHPEPLSFVHFELRNARPFLHRRDRQSTLAAIRSRYLALRLTTEWSVHELLKATGLLETGAIWLTVARAILLAPTTDLIRLEAACAGLNAALQNILPGLRARIRSTPLSRADLEAGRFRQAFAQSFGDLPDGAAHLDDPSEPAGVSDRTATALKELEHGLAQGWAAADTGPRPVFEGLSDWLRFAAHAPAGNTAACTRLKLSPIWTPIAAGHRIGDPKAPLALVRGDLRGYKSDMLELGGDSLVSMLTRSAWTQWSLAARGSAAISAVNTAFAPSEQVVVVHSFGDDLICYGAPPAAEAAQRALEIELADLAKGFYAALVPVMPGMSDYQVGRESGRLARERRASR